MDRLTWAMAVILIGTVVLMSWAGEAPVQGAPLIQDTSTPRPTPLPPTNTPLPTDTPVPPTNTPLPTDTPAPTATAAPTSTSAPPPTVRPTQEPQPPPAAPAPSAHLTLGLTAEPTTPAAGGKVIYRILVTNDGNAPAEGVIVTCDVPAGMKVLKVTVDQGTARMEGQRVIAQPGSLGAGASTTIVIETQLKTSVGAGVPLSLTASATAEGGLSAISAPVVVQIPAVPSTGSGLMVVLLVIGLVLAAIVLIARGLQMTRPSR